MPHTAKDVPRRLSKHVMWHMSNIYAILWSTVKTLMITKLTIQSYVQIYSSTGSMFTVQYQREEVMSKKEVTVQKMYTKFTVFKLQMQILGNMCVYLRYHIWALFILLIFFWSWRIPYSSASADGGQPGMYISTGIIRSQPRTTAYE